MLGLLADFSGSRREGQTRRSKRKQFCSVLQRTLEIVEGEEGIPNECEVFVVGFGLHTPEQGVCDLMQMLQYFEDDSNLNKEYDNLKSLFSEEETKGNCFRLAQAIHRLFHHSNLFKMKEQMQSSEDNLSFPSFLAHQIEQVRNGLDHALANRTKEDGFFGFGGLIMWGCAEKERKWATKVVDRFCSFLSNPTVDETLASFFIEERVDKRWSDLSKYMGNWLKTVFFSNKGSPFNFSSFLFPPFS